MADYVITVKKNGERHVFVRKNAHDTALLARDIFLKIKKYKISASDGRLAVYSGSTFLQEWLLEKDLYRDSKAGMDSYFYKVSPKSAVYQFNDGFDFFKLRIDQAKEGV